jgi:hypothetical protein
MLGNKNERSLEELIVLKPKGSSKILTMKEIIEQLTVLQCRFLNFKINKIPHQKLMYLKDLQSMESAN